MVISRDTDSTIAKKLKHLNLQLPKKQKYGIHKIFTSNISAQTRM